MKTETLPLLHYSNYSPLVLEKNQASEKKTYLRIIKEGKLQNQQFSTIKSSVEDPGNWDESWFANYE